MMENNDSIPTMSPKIPSPMILEKIVMTSSLALVIILALIGNLIVIIVFCRYKPLRKFANSFIVSLAVADMMVGAVSMPAWILNVIWNYAYTEMLRDVWVCMDIVAGVASILNLTAVSVYRYFQITKPYTHREIVTKRRVFGSLVCIWISAGLMATLKGIMPYNTNLLYCRPGYQLLVVISSFIAPLVAISYCYFRIFKEVSRQQNQLPKVESDQQKNHFAIEIKAIKTIAIVVVVFVICWCPFFVVILVNGFCKCVTNGYLITCVKIMHYCNSALNPIIYVWYNTQYRKSFINAVGKMAQHYDIESAVRFLNDKVRDEDGGESRDSSPIIIKQRHPDI